MKPFTMGLIGARRLTATVRLGDAAVGEGLNSVMPSWSRSMPHYESVGVRNRS
jgi:hypothetical protein